jgi:NitT/TauT family transport system ATP-binding protein
VHAAWLRRADRRRRSRIAAAARLRGQRRRVRFGRRSQRLRQSTLLLIAGLLPASRGSIEIGGATVDGPPPGIGIVFQSHVPLPWRTVLTNIPLQAEVRRLPREQASLAPTSWSRWSASASRTSFPAASGGMQQRVDLPRAGARSGDPA